MEYLTYTDLCENGLSNDRSSNVSHYKWFYLDKNLSLVLENIKYHTPRF